MKFHGELHKPGYETQGSVTRASIALLKKLSVGGCEGAKFLSELELDNRGLRSNYIVKEYPYDNDFNKNNKVRMLNNICKSYTLLGKKGFLVPQTVRYFINERERKIFLLMTDMTQGGKKRIWGVSDDMTNAQYKELQNMDLSIDDTKFIQHLVARLSARATIESIRFRLYYYHILQDVESKKLEICFLDVDSLDNVNFRQTNLDENWERASYEPDRENKEDAESFYLYLLESMKKDLG